MMSCRSMAVSLLLACAVPASTGCQLNIYLPVADARMEGENWGPVSSMPHEAYINSRFDRLFEKRSSQVAVRCGIRAPEPENTVEVDVFSIFDSECDVVVELLGSGAPTSGTVGAYRRSDGQGHWSPDRRFHPWSSGDAFTIPPHGSIHITVPSSNLFGHFPPEGGDSFTLACTGSSADGGERVDGRVQILKVTRDKDISIGH